MPDTMIDLACDGCGVAFRQRAKNAGRYARTYCTRACLARAPRRRRPLSERMESLSIPEPNSGCFLWLGRFNRDGYGIIMIRNASTRAHRVAYELEYGPIPVGLQLDHLCRIRSCVNPRHLEAVTHRENCLRGISPVGQNARATSCHRGHPFDEANTRREVRKSGLMSRKCRACQRDRQRSYRLQLTAVRGAR